MGVGSKDISSEAAEFYSGIEMLELKIKSVPLVKA